MTQEDAQADRHGDGDPRRGPRPQYDGWGPYPQQQWSNWSPYPGGNGSRSPPPAGFTPGPWPWSNGGSWWTGGSCDHPGNRAGGARMGPPRPQGYSPRGCRHHPGWSSWPCWTRRFCGFGPCAMKSGLRSMIPRVLIGLPMILLIGPLIWFALSHLHLIVAIAVGVSLWRKQCSERQPDHPQEDRRRFQGQADDSATPPSAPAPDRSDIPKPDQSRDDAGSTEMPHGDQDTRSTGPELRRRGYGWNVPDWPPYAYWGTEGY